MLSDNEIKSIVKCSQSISNDCLDNLRSYFIDVVNDENSSRKKIISSIFEFQNNVLIFCNNSLSDMYLKGYRKGYEDALLESSGFKNIVDRAVKVKKKKH